MSVRPDPASPPGNGTPPPESAGGSQWSLTATVNVWVAVLVVAILALLAAVLFAPSSEPVERLTDLIGQF
ncbi:hypothetical protein ACIBPB_27160 [Micromonospora sp. NPDC049836]|uniref:hypothetical protein n=1 Tax=Micromonospora sp. NPDC049836 TaxID=3364274 RepID=UPI0037AF6BF9